MMRNGRSSTIKSSKKREWQDLEHQESPGFSDCLYVSTACSIRSFRLSPDQYHDGGANNGPSDEQNSVRTSAEALHRNRQAFLFPRWDFDNQQDDDLCSLLSNIVDFAHGFLAGHATTIDRPKTRPGGPRSCTLWTARVCG